MASLLAASAAKRRLPILMSFYSRLSSSTCYIERREGEGEKEEEEEEEKDGGWKQWAREKFGKIYGAPPKGFEKRAYKDDRLPAYYIGCDWIYPWIAEAKCDNKPEIKVVSELWTAKLSPGKEKLQQDDTIPSPVPITGDNKPEIKVVSELWWSAKLSPRKEKLQQDDTIPSPVPISGCRRIDPWIAEAKCDNKPEIKVVPELWPARLSLLKKKLQQDDTIPSPVPISGDNKPEIKVMSELWTAKLSPRKEKLQQDDTIPSPVPISEMEHQPSNANQATETKHQPSKNANQANGKKSSRRDEDGAKKRERVSLINALERNNELLRAQLEDQKSSFQLAREEHKEQHERLVAALTKITGALEKVADKL